ncbi:cation:proton antiporter [Changpingibacter yushuensis]|uniref:cation:proton antiporter n=1 Tax=Changpingibacter yushuensis TaxID=2758440 RepID=UPI002483EDBE|nr:cation:proton antiporter [Changpingibacter yushuensis]
MLGAVLSPTDAVATSIVKSTGVSPRIVAILEGEGLLNDATALVMLRTAITAAATAFSLWGVVGMVVYSVVMAAAIGYVVGRLNLCVRRNRTNTIATTTLSLVVPFVAMVPAEQLEASGLVAAVVAGLVSGQGAAKHFSPQQRTSDAQTWATIEFILEGVVFLTMGLQFHTLLEDLPTHNLEVVGRAVAIALIALVGSLAIRALFVAPLLAILRRRSLRQSKMKPKLELFQEVLAGDGVKEALESVRQTGELPDGAVTNQQRAQLEEHLPGRYTIRRRWLTRTRKRTLTIGQLRSRLTRTLADTEYFLASPLTERDGAVVVWAGMRGAITVAAAQSLPANTPQRSYLVLIAFLVAGFSLLIQGGTLKQFVVWVKPTPGSSPEQVQADADDLQSLLDAAAEEYMERAQPKDDTELGTIVARRTQLLHIRDDHTFEASLLQSALANLDAQQIVLEMQQAPFLNAGD